MRNSGKLAKVAVLAVATAGVLAVCGAGAQAAPASHAAQVSGGSVVSTAAETVGFSGRVIEFQSGHLKLATADGEVTFEVSKGAYRYGPAKPGSHAYVAAYRENGTWVATAIFTYP